MSELSAELIRRLLWATRFDGSDAIWWRHGDGNDFNELHIYARCNDFFDWGCSDCEPIETEADVTAFEQARADLVTAEDNLYPQWTGELYAARRRQHRAATFMTRPDSKYYLGDDVAALFLSVGPSS